MKTELSNDFRIEIKGGTFFYIKQYTIALISINPFDALAVCDSNYFGHYPIGIDETTGEIVHIKDIRIIDGLLSADIWNGYENIICKIFELDKDYGNERIEKIKDYGIKKIIKTLFDVKEVHAVEELIQNKWCIFENTLILNSGPIFSSKLGGKNNLNINLKKIENLRNHFLGKKLSKIKDRIKNKID